MPFVPTFLVGIIFSYLGSIPPGMINISVLQLSMQNRKAAALSFTLACVLVEFIYAAIAVQFQMFLTDNTSISSYFQLITAIVLFGLGIANLIKKTKAIEPQKGEKRNAFLKGTLISIANPLAIPFWLAVTISLQSMDWIVLEGAAFWWYITGISTGTFLLLLTIIVLASRYSLILNNHFLVHKVPGLIFIGMGLWSFFQWAT